MATIREKGAYQWHVQVRRRGWPTQSKTLRTRKEAEAWAREVETQMDKAVFVDRTPAERTTFREVLERYLVEVTDKRPGEASRKGERARIERFIREEPELCAHAVANLTPEHFEDWRDRRLQQIVRRGREGGRGRYKPVAWVPKLRKDGSLRANAVKPKAAPKAAKTVAPGTVRRELTTLKRVIDHCKKRLKLISNPVNSEDVRRPSVYDERDVRLRPEEIARLLEVCRLSDNPWLAPFVELAFETGARRGSLLRLEWRDVNFGRRTALLRGVKNSRRPEVVIDHPVALSPRALEILRDLEASRDKKEPRVLPTTADAVQTAFGRARAKANVRHFRLHDARHERASSLVEAGWSDSQVMAMTGHRDPKSLRRYVNLRREHLADALALLPSTASR
jgi:integrase